MASEILSFNYSPAEYADASWFDAFEYKDIIQELISSDDGKSVVSRMILEHYHLHDKLILEFDDPFKKIALQPRAVLVKIIFHAGLVANCKFLKGMIQRKQVSLIESSLGKEAYSFAIKKAPLICGKLPDLLSFAVSMDWNDTQFIKKHVFRSGMRLLGIIFAKEHEGYKKRFLFNFPATSQEYFDRGAGEEVSSEIKRQVLAVFKKLMKEFCL